MSTTSNEQARFVLLEQWARAAAGAGFPVPAKPHLVAIAQSGGVTPLLQRVQEVGMWQPTIAWLVQQADAGTKDALAKLPKHLVRPTKPGANGGANPVDANGSGAGTQEGDVRPPSREEVRFVRLREWHRAAVGRGLAGAEGLREMHLRLVANSHVSTSNEIRSIFPPVVGQFADELSTALSGTGAGQSGGATGAADGASGGSGLEPGAAANATAGTGTGTGAGAGAGAGGGSGVETSGDSGAAGASGTRTGTGTGPDVSDVGAGDSFGGAAGGSLGGGLDAGGAQGKVAQGGNMALGDGTRGNGSQGNDSRGNDSQGNGSPGNGTPGNGTSGAGTHAAGENGFAQGGVAQGGLAHGDAGPTGAGQHVAGQRLSGEQSPGQPRAGQPGAGQPGGAAGQHTGAAQDPAVPDLSVDPDGFSPYEFGATSDEPLPLMIRRRPDGGISVSWPKERPGGASSAGASEASVVVDRLITSDEYAPYSPDASRLVVATRGTEGVDELEFAHAARHYQVWRSVGTSIDDAKLSQPVKYASGELVSPVLDFDLREDEGRVIGQWRVLPGTTRVQVFRIPIQYAAGSSGDPQYRILHDDENLGGFVDTTADRGQRYLYQVFAEAEFDSVARLSAPTNQDLLVSAVHEPVRDLEFELLDSEEEPLFDLSWSEPPGGQVVVFRTQKPPQPGIERQAIPAAALDQAGLPDERKQSHPIVTEGGRASMRQVPWPRGWTRAYFTTVVMLGDRAYVGNTVRGVRVPKVTRPKIVERVNRQVLTFEWPEGADIVLAYSSMSGVSSEIAMQGQPIEVSRTDYREQGGLEFPRGRLDTNGCDLHLVSVAFDGGQRVLAAPEVVHYPGLLRIFYRVLTSSLADGRPYIRVQLLSESDVEQAPPFVLVHNPERLPLTVGDGRPVAVVPENSPGGAAQRRFVPTPLPSQGSGASTWVVEPDHFVREVQPTGFLRLFVALPPDALSRVALLDPSIDMLRLRPPQMAGGGMPGGGVS